jgi:hypothetical protein
MTFTKEAYPYYQSPDFGHFYNCKLYTLHDDHNIVGQFIISHDVAFISTNDIKFRVDIKNNIFTPSEYTISDIKSKAKIGFYNFSIWKIGWKEIGSLSLNDERYVCNIQISDIGHNIFKKSTWGHYKISLKNQFTEVVYTINVQTNWLNVKNSEFRNAKGEVKSNQSDIPLILAGLFFFERMFSVNNERA